MKNNNNVSEYTFATGLIIKVGEHIDYKPPTEYKLDLGKIEQFKKSPESRSMWMRVSKIEDATKKDWISCEVWKEQKDSGLFENKLQLTTEPVKNDTSTEPKNIDDLPF